MCRDILTSNQLRARSDPNDVCMRNEMDNRDSLHPCPLRIIMTVNLWSRLFDQGPFLCGVVGMAKAKDYSLRQVWLSLKADAVESPVSISIKSLTFRIKDMHLASRISRISYFHCFVRSNQIVHHVVPASCYLLGPFPDHPDCWPHRLPNQRWGKFSSGEFIRPAGCRSYI